MDETVSANTTSDKLFANNWELQNCTNNEDEKSNINPKDLVVHLAQDNEFFVKILEEQNACIEQFDLKPRKLSKKINQSPMCDNIFSNRNTVSQITSKKLAKLSKKIREQNSLLEVYKTKVSKLENQLNELNKRTNDESQHNFEPQKANVNKDDKAFKTLEEKLGSTMNKWIEEKNRNLQLKNNLKLANKWFQLETGETLDTLISRNSKTSWRGRAQIICDLQKKNQDLRETLKSYKTREAGTSLPEDLHTDCEASINKLKCEQLKLQDSLTILRKKYEVSKTRCGVLESECRELKQKSLLIKKKFEENQIEVDALKYESCQSNKLKNANLKEKEKIIEKLKESNELLELKLSKLNHLQLQSLQPNDSSVKYESQSRLLEADRLRLLELTEAQCKHLETERNAHTKTLQLLKVEKQKRAKLEAAIAKLQLQLKPETCNSYCKTTPQLTELTAQDKLELALENVKMLRTRLDVEIHEKNQQFQVFASILKQYNAHKIVYNSNF